jgi:hypothetical protein
MRKQINKIKNFGKFLNENVVMNRWVLFDNTSLLPEQIESVNKYSILSNTTPKEMFIKQNKILVSFSPKIYSLSKEQIVKLSEIDFLEYDMDSYGVSIITLK